MYLTRPCCYCIVSNILWVVSLIDAGRGNVEVTILDPSGHRDKVKSTIKAAGKDGVYLVEYTAKEVGLHSITVTFGSSTIPHSPFGVNVSPGM